MKPGYRFIVTSLLVLFSASVFAQAADTKTLVNEGLALFNQKNYPAAIEKYNAALAIDPESASANYNLAFALYKTGAGTAAIPHLEKTTQSESVVLKSGAYKLLGAIYDQANQPQKAIENYTAGLKIDTDLNTIQNLSLAYFRNKQYAEAEIAAISGITLAPKEAVNSYRTYALVTFHQNKRAAALLGFCSFLMLEPNTARSAEAYGNIQHILQGGALKPEHGETAPHHISADDNALNQAITQAIATEARRKYFVATDKFTEQLRAIFTSVGALAEKQIGNDFFRNYMAAYFYKLAQSPNIPAFARLISSSTSASTKWMKDNPQKMTDLDNWIKETERKF